MVIEIDPPAVIRSAGAIQSVLAQPAEAPSPSGNEGFMMTAALGRFTAAMQQLSAQASTGTGTTAENLHGSAKLLDDVDGDAATLGRSLSSRVV